MEAAPLDRVTVHSQHGEHKAYLEIVPDGTAIRVQPTALGKKKLNRFWTMWLRKLLLEQAPEKRGYAVETRNNNVRITSDASIDAMMGTVHQIAAQIQPLREPPLVRDPWDTKNVSSMRITVKPTVKSLPDEQVAAMDWEAILATIQLPDKVTIKCMPVHTPGHGYADVWLRYPRRHSHNLSASELYMLFELEVALACHQ